MNILWLSDGMTVRTGYGTQAALFVPRIIAAGHTVTMFVPHNYTGSPIDIDGVRHHGCGGDTFGNDVLADVYNYYNCDQLITLADPFALQACAGAMRELNVAHWAPVDCKPMGVADISVLREDNSTLIAMSLFGHQMMSDEGFEPLYVPHGIDPQVYSNEGSDLRELVDVGPDTFVIGINSMNRDNRKALTEQMQAFARFNQRHPDSRLMMHSLPVTAGYNLNQVCQRLGIGEAMILPNPFNIQGHIMDNDNMAAWYRTANIVSICSRGEGFGLPALEAQSCGTPVVSNDASAMSELNALGWLTKGQDYWIGGQESWWSTPDVDDIDRLYEHAYQLWKNHPTEWGTLRARCRVFAQQYDADRVMDKYWTPTLAELEKTHD